MRRIACSSVLLLALVGCGQVKAKPDAAVPIDAAVDAADVPIDAGIDAARPDAAVDAPPSPPGQETTTSGARVSGPTYTMDVQIGHPIDQGSVQGSTNRLEANTPIKP